ncbi:MAG: hypothetical protein ACWA5Q_05845 [bacterium]
MSDAVTPSVNEIPWLSDPWDRLHRMYEDSRVPHALLLAGGAGVGKSRLAHEFAALLLCETPMQGQPCGQCKSCHQLEAGTNPGLGVIAPEAPGKQLKVEAIRTFINGATLAVNPGQYRVSIFEHADQMNSAAANALLKTLEEPVPGMVIILLVEASNRLPATILSRCQTLRVASPPRESAVSWLQGRGVDNAGMAIRMAGGGPMRVLNMDQSEAQLSAYMGLLESFLGVAEQRNDPLSIAEPILKDLDVQSILGFLMEWNEVLIRYRVDPSHQEMGFGAQEQRLKTLLKRLDLERLYRFKDRVVRAMLQLSNNASPQLLLDDLLIYWNRINT